jgi:hypothetical protein
VVVVGGIYSPNHQTNRWGWAAVDGRTGQSGARAMSPTVRVRPLELWQSGPPDSPVVHRTVTVHCPVRLLAPALTLRDCPRTVHLSADRWSRTLRLEVVAPLAHQTVRWIIAEWLFQKPEGGKLDSQVRQTKGSLRFLLLLSFWTLTWTFLLVCVEPLAPVEHII